MKKGIAWLLLLCLTAGMLFGCASSSTKEETSVPTVFQEETQEASAQLSETEAEPTEPAETEAETTGAAETEASVVRNIQWHEVNTSSTYDGAGNLSGFLLQGMFLVDSDDHEGFTVENSSGFEQGHEPFYVDSYDPGYMYFSFWLPADSSVEGWHTLTVHFDGVSESVDVYLEYLGDYSHLVGTAESVTGLGWNVKEWKPVGAEDQKVRNIEWHEVNTSSTYDGAGNLSGFLLQGMFLVDSDDHEGFTVENSSGFEQGHEPFYVDSYDPGYMYFSFRLPADSSVEGWHTLTVHFDGVSKSVDVYLEYLGDYSHLVGTAESVTGLGWNVKEWKAVD